MPTSSPDREGDGEVEPDRRSREPRYYVEPAEHRRCLAHFLEAIRSVAPQVLVSLRDDVAPIQDPIQRLVAIEEWGGRFHLLRPGALGVWFLTAADKTVCDWDDDPARRNELRWGELIGPSLTPFWAMTLSATGHHAVKAMAVNLAVPTRDTIIPAVAEGSGVVLDVSKRDAKFEFEAPGWDEKAESREEYAARIISAVQNRLDDERRALERSMQRHRVTPSPTKTAGRHYEWLVKYQIQKWSVARIAREADVNRYAVDKGIKSTAELLIGPGWDTWLLPPPKGGRPRSDS